MFKCPCCEEEIEIISLKRIINISTIGILDLEGNLIEIDLDDINLRDYITEGDTEIDEERDKILCIECGVDITKIISIKKPLSPGKLLEIMKES